MTLAVILSCVMLDISVNANKFHKSILRFKCKYYWLIYKQILIILNLIDDIHHRKSTNKSLIFFFTQDQ